MSTLNRTQFVTRSIYLSFFSFFTVGIGTLLLVTLDQVRETVEAFRSPVQVGWFLVAEFYWALCAWYCARLVLERRFAPYDPLLPCRQPPFAAWVVTWLPRLLGVFATVPLAISVAVSHIATAAWWVRPLPAVVSVVFFVFVVYRRRFFRDLVDYEPALEPGYLFRRFTRVNRLGRRLLAGLALVPVVIFVLLTFGPRVVGRALGTPAVVLFALGSWNLSGGFALIYWPLSRGWAVLTPYPVLLAALISIRMENHNAPIGPPPEVATPRPPDDRPTLPAQWRAWTDALKTSPCRDRPIYLVAAAGGASRAAYWTADVLLALEQHAREVAAQTGTEPCFARNIFAISGVSGGSLGAATAVALLADEQVRNHRAPDLQARAQTFLESDMLAPVAGYLLYHDLIQRIWPFAVTSWDRSHGLEDTWRDDWRDLETTWAKGSSDAQPPNWFDLPLQRLYDGPRAAALPSLFLNTTRVSDGRRVLQSNVHFSPADMYDAFDRRFLTAGLRLAGAVHNSARFTYVSPAGRAWRLGPQGPEPWGYLVDGGYFENSGAATLTEIIRVIPEADRRQLTLILISNEPSDGVTDYACEGGPLVKREPPSSFLMELLAPPFALLNTRTSRAHAADITAIDALGPDAPGRVFEIRIPKVEDHEPPMTWFVSPAVGQDMDDWLVPGHAPTTDGGRLRDNWGTLRDYVVARSTPPSAPCRGVKAGAPHAAVAGR